MKKEDILVLVIVFLAAGLSMYRRYKKKGNVVGSDSKSQTAFPSSSKYDDYEPYSKK